LADMSHKRSRPSRAEELERKDLLQPDHPGPHAADLERPDMALAFRKLPASDQECIEYECQLLMTSTGLTRADALEIVCKLGITLFNQPDAGRVAEAPDLIKPFQKE